MPMSAEVISGLTRTASLKWRILRSRRRPCSVLRRLLHSMGVSGVISASFRMFVDVFCDASDPSDSMVAISGAETKRNAKIMCPLKK